MGRKQSGNGCLLLAIGAGLALAVALNGVAAKDIGWQAQQQRERDYAIVGREKTPAFWCWVTTPLLTLQIDPAQRTAGIVENVTPRGCE